MTEKILKTLPDRPIAPETRDQFRDLDGVQCFHTCFSGRHPLGHDTMVAQFTLYLESGHGYALHFDPGAEQWELAADATGEHDPVMEDVLEPALKEARGDDDVYGPAVWVKFSGGDIEEVPDDVRDDVRDLLQEGSQ